MINNKILLVALPFMLMECSKGGNSPTPITPPVVVVPEADIAFKVEFTPDTAEIDYAYPIYAAPGGKKEINVRIKSALPAEGVLIEVKVTKDADNTTLFYKKDPSVTVSNVINISGLLIEKSTATVLVISKTKDTNKATKTFKISAK
jgi:hypothetical protein